MDCPFNIVSFAPMKWFFCTHTMVSQNYEPRENIENRQNYEPRENIEPMENYEPRENLKLKQLREVLNQN